MTRNRLPKRGQHVVFLVFVVAVFFGPNQKIGTEGHEEREETFLSSFAT